MKPEQIASLTAYLHATLPDLDPEDIARDTARYVRFKRQVNAEIAAVGLLKKRESGKALNGHPGYGYKLRGAKGHKTRVPDPKERRVMQWIVEQRQAGWTWERIYFDLLRRGARTRDGREWSVARIRRAYAAARVAAPCTP